MDANAPITKRLIISGLTPAISAEDISRRLTTFGTVKAADGFGLPDGVGNPRKFGYVTLETTAGKLSKCMNLLSGSTWKGAKLRFGEAKPDFRERVALEKIKAEEEEPKKTRKRKYTGVHAEDMSLVTPDNVSNRPGWKVSSLGRITHPIKTRPAHPLKDPQGITKTSSSSKANKLAKVEKEEKKKKRIKDPETRARMQLIDMTKYGSTHLKGMFLDLEVTGPARRSPTPAVIDEDSSSSEGSGESESEAEQPDALHHTLFPFRKSTPQPSTNVTGVAETANPETTTAVQPVSSQPLQTISDSNFDIQKETALSLNIITSLFGNNDDDWIRREDIESEIDVEGLTKGDKMLTDEEVTEFEVVPISQPGGPLYIPIAGDDEDEDGDNIGVDANIQEPERSITEEKPSKKSTLKDLFAPREEEARFSLLGHLDIDVELDDEAPFLPSVTSHPRSSIPDVQPLVTTTPTVVQTASAQVPLVLNPKQALFFPLSSTLGPEQRGGFSNRARQRDVFDIIKDNGWNWRDPAVGFYRTGTEEDIRKRWEECKGDLTRDWKRRTREAGKISRRKRGGVEESEI